MKKNLSIINTKRVIILLFLLSVWVIIWNSDFAMFSIIPKFLYFVLYHGENGTFIRKFISIAASLSISYIAGLIIYFVTTSLPKYDNKRVEQIKYYSEIDSLRKELYKFNAFVIWMSSDEYKHENDSISVSNMNNKMFFEEKENNTQSPSKMCWENGYSYLVEIANKIKRKSKLLREKIYYNDNLIEVLNEIENCVVINMFTIFPTIHNYYKSLDESSSKNYIIETNNYIKWLEHKYRFDLYQVKYSIVSIDEYKNRQKIFLFALTAELMYANKEYINKSLHTIEILYTTNLIEKENLERANNQIVEYVKLYDYDNELLKPYLKRINNFANLLKESIIFNKYDIYNMYYYNILQLYKRIDDKVFRILFKKYKVKNKLPLVDKFFLFVLNDDKKRAWSVSKHFTIDDNKRIINNPIMNVYKEL